MSYKVIGTKATIRQSRRMPSLAANVMGLEKACDRGLLVRMDVKALYGQSKNHVSSPRGVRCDMSV